MSLADRRAPVDGARMPAPGEVRAWGDTGPPRAAGHVHAGVDLGGVPGTPVMAPERAEVLDVGRLPARPPWTGYAPAVLLRGASGRFHLLAHLSGLGGPIVRPGDIVDLGQTLGHIGAERHVHWEVRTREHARRLRGETTYSITVDPGAWLDGRDIAVPRGPLSLDPTRARHVHRGNAEVLASLPPSFFSSSSPPGEVDEMGYVHE